MGRRPEAMPGSLDPAGVRSGVPRERFGLYQRRVRPWVFGEPAFDEELVDEAICEHRPHVIAYDAWARMVAAAEAEGLDPAPLGIHSAYRPVALQRQIWAYRLEERRRLRAEAGEPQLPQRELERLQQKWTAKPGRSAHHTGLALDLKLYLLGKRRSKRAPAYAWLAANARRFGFYPYLPEGWHWEYNPPGLVAQLSELRRLLGRGEACQALLRAPEVIPVAPPGRRA